MNWTTTVALNGWCIYNGLYFSSKISEKWKLFYNFSSADSDERYVIQISVLRWNIFTVNYMYSNIDYSMNHYITIWDVLYEASRMKTDCRTKYSWIFEPATDIIINVVIRQSEILERFWSIVKKFGRNISTVVPMMKWEYVSCYDT